jgi:folate-binding protein YgfZ
MTAIQYSILADRGVVEISGEEARSFLQGMISNDIDKLAPGEAIYAAFLTPQGKYLFDFFIVEQDGALLFDVEAARRDELIKRFTLYRLRAKVAFADRTGELCVAALWGNDTAAVLGLNPAPGTAETLADGRVYTDPRLAAAGARAILPAATLSATLDDLGATSASPEEYDRHRLALGLPDGSRDLIVEKSLLLESGFDELHGVDFEKGCYVGQELTARTKFRGLVRKRLLRVDLEGSTPEPGTPVMAGGIELGEMRSARDGIGLALLRLDRLASARAEGTVILADGAALTPVTPDWAVLPEIDKTG